MLDRHIEHFNCARRMWRQQCPNAGNSKVDQCMAAHPLGTAGWHIMPLEQFTGPGLADITLPENALEPERAEFHRRRKDAFAAVANPKEAFWIRFTNSLEPHGLNAACMSSKPKPVLNLLLARPDDVNSSHPPSLATPSLLNRTSHTSQPPNSTTASAQKQR